MNFYYFCIPVMEPGNSVQVAWLPAIGEKIMNISFAQEFMAYDSIVKVGRRITLFFNIKWHIFNNIEVADFLSGRGAIKSSAFRNL